MRRVRPRTNHARPLHGTRIRSGALARDGQDDARAVSARVFGLNAATYSPHDLHRTERIWLETNCYVDLWIELLHTLKLDPVASMAFTLAMDFEGDQWTFFKQPAA